MAPLENLRGVFLCPPQVPGPGSWPLSLCLSSSDLSELQMRVFSPSGPGARVHPAGLLRQGHVAHPGLCLQGMGLAGPLTSASSGLRGWGVGGFYPVPSLGGNGLASAPFHVLLTRVTDALFYLLALRWCSPPPHFLAPLPSLLAPNSLPALGPLLSPLGHPDAVPSVPCGPHDHPMALAFPACPPIPWSPEGSSRPRSPPGPWVPP